MQLQLQQGIMQLPKISPQVFRLEPVLLKLLSQQPVLINSVILFQLDSVLVFTVKPTQELWQEATEDLFSPMILNWKV